MKVVVVLDSSPYPEPCFKQIEKQNNIRGLETTTISF
jgi:hypothetical protein